jgi:hypothetical protein
MQHIQVRLFLQNGQHSERIFRERQHGHSRQGVAPQHWQVGRKVAGAHLRASFVCVQRDCRDISSRPFQQCHLLCQDKFGSASHLGVLE